MCVMYFSKTDHRAFLKCTSCNSKFVRSVFKNVHLHFRNARCVLKKCSSCTELCSPCSEKYSMCIENYRCISKTLIRVLKFSSIIIKNVYDALKIIHLVFEYFYAI